MSPLIDTKEATQIILNSLGIIKKDIATNMVKAKEVASGETIRSMRVEPSDFGGILFGRQAFQTVQTGRKQGKTPYTFQTIIEQWIKDKGIQIAPIPYERKETANWRPKYTAQQRGLNQASFLIARKIREQGTSLYQKGGREDIYTPAIDKELPNTKRKLGQLLKLDIERI